MTMMGKPAVVLLEGGSYEIFRGRCNHLPRIGDVVLIYSHNYSVVSVTHDYDAGSIMVNLKEIINAD